MERADGAFQTGDMSLAAVLALNGFSYKLEEDGRRCRWVFKHSLDQEEELDQIVFTYAQNGSLVEPRAYLGEVSRLREEMYRFLGIGDRRRRSSASPSAQSI